MINRFRQVGQYFSRLGFSRLTWALCLCLMTMAATYATWLPEAIAMPNRAADIEMSRAADELDQIAGAGTSDKVEGRVQSGMGKAKRSLGDTFDDAQVEAEGAADQVKGSVNRGMGQAKDAAEDAGDAVGDASESFADSVKDFFGQ